MTAPASGVRLERDGAIAWLTVGTGAARNALTSPDWTVLAERVRALGTDPGLRALVVRGEGDTFSAGSDMREWAAAGPEQVEGSFRAMEEAFTTLEELPVPVLAQVRGFAAGAGCQLALACDLRVMARSARIGLPIARLGILTSPAFAARVMAVAGADTAADLLYTGRLLSAEEAFHRGLATRLAADGELDRVTAEVLDSIVSQPPAAVRAAKRAIAVGLRPTRDAARANPPREPVAFDELRAAVVRFLRRHPPAAAG